MTVPRLASKESCTGCGACIAACNKGCIQFETDDLGVRTPSVDVAQCVGCGACTKVCHLLNGGLLYEKSDVVYAAWQTCADDRRTSASGGLASALYRWALSRGMHCYGVPADDLYGFRFVELEDERDVQRCKNSKYVETDVMGVFRRAREQLRCGDEVLFVGLPCQVAALRTFVGNRLAEGLTCVDIICHGVCPASYLEDHVRGIERKRKRVTARLSFRDPKFETKKYRLTLSDTQGLFYEKGPKSSDAYQVGYHSALTYRENCFSCRYAQGCRVGDLTIGDFSGYGKRGPATAGVEKVSCAVVSTSTGVRVLSALAEFGVEVEKRDPEEAFLYERQLQGPSIRHPGRSAFLKTYGAGSGFDAAVRAAAGWTLLRNDVVETLRLREANQLVRSLVPKGIKRAVKKFLKKQ